MATVVERFNAAVNVIKNLPKNGSYQPSNAMLLTFYAYYKQATEGPCTQRKPNFWDVVKRAKWDAWYALRDMSRDRAMELYVDELKKIIETMSYTENVANFMGSISELDNVNFDDLEAIAPEIMQKARSHPNSPFASRASSPLHTSPLQNGFGNGNLQSSSEPNNYLHQNGYGVDQSDDEYIDTVEDDHETQLLKRQRSIQNQNVVSTRSDIGFDTSRDSSVPVLQQILVTVQRMNTDINNLSQKITLQEKQLSELKNTQSNNWKLLQRRYPPWWPFKDISPLWFSFLILWPFLAQRLGRALQRRK